MGVRRAFRGGRLLGQPQAWQAALLGTCETVRPDAAPAGAPRSPAGPGGQPWSRSGQSSRWPAGTAVPDPRGPLLSLPLPPLSRRPCPAPELTQVHSELRSPPLTAGGDRAALPGAPRAAAAACALPRPPSLSSLRSPVGVGWGPVSFVTAGDSGPSRLWCGTRSWGWGGSPTSTEGLSGSPVGPPVAVTPLEARHPWDQDRP